MVEVQLILIQRVVVLETHYADRKTHDITLTEVIRKSEPFR